MYLCKRKTQHQQQMKRLVPILFLASLLLSSCFDDSTVLSLLDHAEAVMEAHPDSAYQDLCEVDSLIPEQSRRTRMRHLFLIAEAANKLYLPLPSDTLFQEAIDYYDHHGTPNQQLKAHYLLGCIYRDRGEAPQALQCYYDAVEKADTLSADCDYTTLYKVYGQMADVLERQIMPQEEISALKEYSKYAQKAGNIYEHIRGIELMSTPYTMLGDTLMVLLTEQKAHDLFMHYGFTQAAERVYVMSIYIYLERGEYEKAGKMMQRYEKNSGLFDKAGNIEQGKEHYYHAKGLYYMGIHQLDSAEHYFKRLLKHQYSYDGYRGLMHVNMEKGMTNSVIFYAKGFENSLDTLVTELHAEATRQALGMYNYSRQQKIATEKAEESEQRKTIIYIIIIVFIIAMSLFYHLYTRDKNRRKQENSRLNQQLFDLSRLYEKNQEEIVMMEMDYAAFKARKQQELSELQTQMEQLQEEYGNLQQHEKFDALMQSTAADAIKSKLKSYQSLTEKECNTLMGMFKQNMPMLYTRMTDGHVLGTLELRVAVLTRMDFRSDDIAILLNVSRQSVSNARASVNKKLFSDGSARTLFKNLSRL